MRVIFEANKPCTERCSFELVMARSTQKKTSFAWVEIIQRHDDRGGTNGFGESRIKIKSNELKRALAIANLPELHALEGEI